MAGDLARAVAEVEAALATKAARLDELDPIVLAERLSKAVSLIDISKTARAVTGNAAGDAYLDQARELLLKLLGVIP